MVSFTTGSVRSAILATAGLLVGTMLSHFGRSFCDQEVAASRVRLLVTDTLILIHIRNSFVSKRSRTK